MIKHLEVSRLSNSVTRWVGKAARITWRLKLNAELKASWFKSLSTVRPFEPGSRLTNRTLLIEQFTSYFSKPIPRQIFTCTALKQQPVYQSTFGFLVTNGYSTLSLIYTSIVEFTAVLWKFGLLLSVKFNLSSLKTEEVSFSMRDTLSS
jgi:hypothetical protein